MNLNIRPIAAKREAADLSFAAGTLGLIFVAEIRGKAHVKDHCFRAKDIITMNPSRPRAHMWPCATAVSAAGSLDEMAGWGPMS